mmetsp:Transcript_55189/g.178913  ORF Transcript_55189/g.178913 Transcript_55189/m.178913 type:complete len:294 (+) Transcript_55189:181-1062(+)
MDGRTNGRLDRCKNSCTRSKQQLGCAAFLASFHAVACLTNEVLELCRRSPLVAREGSFHTLWGNFLVGGVRQQVWGNEGVTEAGRQVAEEHDTSELNALPRRSIGCGRGVMEGGMQRKASTAIVGRVENLEQQAFTGLHVLVVHPPVLLRWQHSVNLAHSMRIDELQIHHITRALAAPFNHAQWVLLNLLQRHPHVHKREPLLQGFVNALLRLPRLEQRSRPRVPGAHRVVTVDADGWTWREHRRGAFLIRIGLRRIPVDISGDVVEHQHSCRRRECSSQDLLGERVQCLTAL